MDENDRLLAGDLSLDDCVTLPPLEEEPPVDGADRPQIILGPRVDLTEREALTALAKLPDVFVRGSELVRVAGGKVIRLTTATLVQSLSRAADFLKCKRIKGGKTEIAPAAPPAPLARAMIEAGHYPGMRELLGVSALPPVRLDATVASKHGYDEATKLYYAPTGWVPTPPEAPTLEDARRAYQELLSHTRLFPFEGDDDRAAWVAGAMTPIAWPMFSGPTPGVLVDAPSRDVGKSKLAGLGAMIGLGQPAKRRRWPTGNEDEQAKVLATIASTGQPCAFVDNIRGSLGGAALDVYLTSGGEGGGYADRLLATNTDIEVERPPMLWFSGNNVQLHADTSRRLLSVRLEWRPQPGGPRRASQRTGLPPLPGPSDAPALWLRIVTILRAWVLDGRPQQDLPAFGSYESWSAVVRAAVHWVSGHDPCAARKRLEEVDAEEVQHAALISALVSTFGSRPFDARTVVHEAKRDEGLREALVALGCADKRTGNLDAVLVGNRFRRLKGAADDEGRALARVGATRKDISMWRIETF